MIMMAACIHTDLQAGAGGGGGGGSRDVLRQPVGHCEEYSYGRSRRVTKWKAGWAQCVDLNEPSLGGSRHRLRSQMTPFELWSFVSLNLY